MNVAVGRQAVKQYLFFSNYTPWKSVITLQCNQRFRQKFSMLEFSPIFFRQHLCYLFGFISFCVQLCLGTASQATASNIYVRCWSEIYTEECSCLLSVTPHKLEESRPEKENYLCFGITSGHLSIKNKCNFLLCYLSDLFGLHPKISGLPKLTL